MQDGQGKEIPKRGEGTVIWEPHLSNIHPTASFGKNCKIHSNVWIGSFVKVGDNCKIQAFAFIPQGVLIEDNVFIGPHVCFTNDKHPPSNGTGWCQTFVESDVVIGAGAIILPGVRLCKGCVIGAGAVVTKTVPSGVTVVGNPARVLQK